MTGVKQILSERILSANTRLAGVRSADVVDVRTFSRFLVAELSTAENDDVFVYCEMTK